jgi:alanine racemase
LLTGPVARIDLAALEHNLRRARQAAPQSRVMAVIKANAYGHGLLPVARRIADQADALAVARVEEGLVLRRAGIGCRIIVLEGFHDDDELSAALASRIEVVLHQPYQIESLRRRMGTSPEGMACWLKVDTGMHRLGFRPEEILRLAAELHAIDGLVLAGVITHLANADQIDSATTKEQLDRFAPIMEDPNLSTSIANSAGILGWPDSRTEWIRPGIMLYGASPFGGGSNLDPDLRPVMTLNTRLIAIRKLRKGEPVGYGGTWTCPEDMPVGVAAIGYGDGYPRHAPSGTPVRVNGRLAKLIGRVSMDMISIDLRDVPTVAVGDKVTLWGDWPRAEEVAHRAGTIAYELYCGITSRVEYRYTDEG